MTNDLIQDVENAMREERTMQMWREYGPYIVGGAVLAVILTAGMAGYRSWNEHVNQKNTGLLMDALESKDKVAALEKIDGLLRPGQQVIGRMTIAGQMLKDGKKDEALKAYRSVADDQAVAPLYRDLALWLSVRLDWAMHPDKAAAQGQIEKLQPIIDGKDNPWAMQARMEAARIAAHGLGDYAMARAFLAPVLASQDVTPSERQRAEALDHVYALQAPPAVKTNQPD